MVLAGMSAGDKSVQTLDSVRKSVLYKEIERAICDRRLRGETALCENFEDDIGAERTVLG